MVPLLVRQLFVLEVLLTHVLQIDPKLACPWMVAKSTPIDGHQGWTKPDLNTGIRAWVLSIHSGICQRFAAHSGLASSSDLKTTFVPARRMHVLG